MSVKSKSGQSPRGEDAPIPFGRKYTESEKFSVVFREGMALVEATAAYLDGDGREDARRLNSSASLAYATVSMRLTTRLMQLASWLLIRRAVNDGEMTPGEAFEEQNKVKFQLSSARSVKDKAYEALPDRLKELNDASTSLYRRVLAIDKLLKAELEGTQAEDPARGVGDQMSRLTDAFGPVSEAVPVKAVPSTEPE